MRPTAVLVRDALRPPLAGLPRWLSEAGLDACLVPHLYHLSEESPIWRELARLDGATVFLLPFYPRPIEALLRQRGVWRADSFAVDLRAWETPDALARELRGRLQPPEGCGTVRTLEGVAGMRWYPLLDEDRCTHCGNCQQFCLFGVYEMHEQKLHIAHPDLCKPGCPACSRICPQGALIFPLYAREPAIAGAPGEFPKPDAAARKMYYARTALACPKCGEPGPGAVQPDAAACEECGRSRVSARVPDELDALLDGLERLQEGQR